MLDFHSFFCRLFFVCAAALLCEVLSENTQSSSGKGLSAAIKTVCALCVCVSVFSFFGNITGKGNFDISTFFALPEVSEEQVTSGTENFSLLLEKTKAELETQIKNAVSDKYGINPDAVRIDLTVNKKNSGTEVTLSSVSLSFGEETPEELRNTAQSYVNGLLFGSSS